ncbi:MAG: hypothetical protein HQL86_04985, partial [Magnetococcales bacterium]|nr:hypothetical protein [Magnetococcales bacterium]
GLTEERRTGACWREIRLDTWGTAGGILIRSDAVATVPADFDCIVPGGGPEGTLAVEFTAPDMAPVRLVLNGARLALPDDAPPLRSPADYNLAFIGRNGSVLKSFPVQTMAGDSPGGRCILRID